MFQKLFGYNTNTLTLWVYKQQTCGKRVERKAHALYADMDIYILVGGFKHFFIFHNIWDVILPIDFHIFQRGRSTTNQYI